MNKAKAELIKFSAEDDKQSFVYSLEHNNGRTSVEQELTISSVRALMHPDWIASVNLGDFPPQKTPALAAIKLADWLERLAASIRCGNYIDIQKAAFIDLDVNAKEGEE